MATYSLVLLRKVEGLDVVYVPIGLGSGICGMMAARDALELDTRIVGEQVIRMRPATHGHEYPLERLGSGGFVLALEGDLNAIFLDYVADDQAQGHPPPRLLLEHLRRQFQPARLT